VLSLRARILLGAIFWMTALFVAAGMVLTHMMAQSTRAPFFFHRVFQHMDILGVLIVICLGVGMWMVRRGLSSFDELRTQLVAVKEGKVRRLEGAYPSEVQPLINDLNSLLEDREERVTRALKKAGDLAHGLKTPLTLLTQQAERAKAAGQVELAAAGGNPGARCHVLTSADALARTMMTIHADRRLAIDVHVSHEHFARTQREDLEEMLGNLVDNACKWAKTRVAIGSTHRADRVVITVDDDGPGLDPSLRESVLQRGVRADEAAPGSGLGLAIVADLVELYGGSIALTSAPIGGLRATLQLPAA
jgi:signal transduction histidine kinase